MSAALLYSPSPRPSNPSDYCLNATGRSITRLLLRQCYSCCTLITIQTATNTPSAYCLNYAVDAGQCSHHKRRRTVFTPQATQDSVHTTSDAGQCSHHKRRRTVFTPQATQDSVHTTSDAGQCSHHKRRRTVFTPQATQDSVHTTSDAGQCSHHKRRRTVFTPQATQDSVHTTSTRYNL